MRRGWLCIEETGHVRGESFFEISFRPGFGTEMTVRLDRYEKNQERRGGINHAKEKGCCQGLSKRCVLNENSEHRTIDVPFQLWEMETNCWKCASLLLTINIKDTRGDLPRTFDYYSILHSILQLKKPNIHSHVHKFQQINVKKFYVNLSTDSLTRNNSPLYRALNFSETKEIKYTFIFSRISTKLT